MAKRRLTPFSLAFLDIMFCGFGAVVLLVMILNGEVLRKREARSENLRGELSRATTLEDLARTHLTDVKTKIEEAKLEQGTLGNVANDLKRKIAGAGQAREAAERKLAELRRTSDRLKREKAALENSAKILKSKKPEAVKPGKKKIGFTGDGKRQYLTGLKLGGNRTLILIDASASMLDETIVNIVRRKLMDADQRRRAPKWQRVLRSAHWLLANLNPDSEYQVFVFNTKAAPLLKGTERKWLSAAKADDLEATLKAMRAIAPEGGTSFHRAFAVASALSPRPDSIILLTDGLPTQGVGATAGASVTSDERLDLFKRAVKRLPSDIPVNTMLFPIEGDPKAAVSFWELAILTRGSFLTPSRDWP